MPVLRIALVCLLAAMLAVAIPRTVGGAPLVQDLALEITPSSGPPGTVVEYTGSGFTPGETVAVVLIEGLGLIVDERTAEAAGTVSGAFAMPHPDETAELLFGPVAVWAIEPAVGREGPRATFSLTQPAPTTPEDPATRPLDYPLPNGHFYRQANGTGGVEASGYPVLNHQPFAHHVRFWDEFQALGGVDANGYPATRSFVHEEFVTQVMQKSVFQWRPDADRVYFVNVLDDLHRAGYDDLLLQQRGIPRQLDLSAEEQGLSFEEITSNRLDFLDANPAMRDFYFAEDDPVLRYGLPVSQVEDLGDFYAIRLQRAVLQQWKIDVPWAEAGQVVVANGGDLAKDVGLWPDFAIVPEAAPNFSSNIVTYEPAAGSTISDAVRIRGDARVFEATVVFDLVSETGNVIASGNTMTQTAAPPFARFDATLEFSVDSRQNGTVRVYEISAETGDRINEVQIPVLLEP